MAKGHIKDYLEKTNIFRSLKLDGIYPRVLQNKLSYEAPVMLVFGGSAWGLEKG